MSWTLSDATRSSLADAFDTEVNSGLGAGKIQVYSGTRPAGPDTAITDQVLLLDFTLADPAFGAASAGVITLDATPAPEAGGEASGTATWARVLNSESVAIADCKVSLSGGGGDLIITTVTISPGLTVTITGGTVTMPAGTAD